MRIKYISAGPSSLQGMSCTSAQQKWVNEVDLWGTLLFPSWEPCETVSPDYKQLPITLWGLSTKLSACVTMAYIQRLSSYGQGRYWTRRHSAELAVGNSSWLTVEPQILVYQISKFIRLSKWASGRISLFFVCFFVFFIFSSVNMSHLKTVKRTLIPAFCVYQHELDNIEVHFSALSYILYIFFQPPLICRIKQYFQLLLAI